MERARSPRTALLASAALVTLLAAGPAAAQAPILYATDGRSCAASTLYQIDPADGSVLATIGPTGVSGLTGLAAHPVTGVLYAISTGGNGCTPNLYTLDRDTGGATLVGPLGVPGGKPDMTFNAAGVLYTFSTDLGTIGTVDLTTGAMTVIGETGVSPWDIGLTFTLDGTLVMRDGETVYTVNTTTGAATTVAPQQLPTDDGNMLTTHPLTGVIYQGDADYEVNEFRLYTLNPTNGAMTLLGGEPGYTGICAIAFAAAPAIGGTGIPTLQTWGLALLAALTAAGAVFFIVRR